MLDSYGSHYDLVYAYKDYETESRKLRRIIQRSNPKARTLLDVACGTGRHLNHLRHSYKVVGLDLSEAQLEIARGRMPDTTFHQGDMLNFDLGCRFDIVTCLFSSIGYVGSRTQLNETVGNLAKHVKPGGLVIVEPWLSPQSWQPGPLWANYIDEPNLKVARISTSKFDGRIVILDFHIIIATETKVEHFTEQHELALFTEDEYYASFQNAGLSINFDSEGLIGRGLFVGQAPMGQAPMGQAPRGSEKDNA